MIVFIAFQPLHSYTIINTSSNQENGFHLLHAELCGSKYSNSVSHIKKLSNLIDRINIAILSDMPEDCVCCNSLDINITDAFTVNDKYISPGLNNHIFKKLYYAPNVKLIPYTNPSRAPPLT